MDDGRDAGQGEGGGDEAKHSHGGEQRATARPISTLIDFTAVWPDVAPRIERSLRRRGTDVDTARDATQEAGARAVERLTTGRTFDGEAGLRRWCHRVAANYVVDRWRVEAHEELVAVDTVVRDVADVVVARVVLEDLVRLWSRLTTAQRDAILARLADETIEDKRSRDRVALTRKRGRERLRDWLGGLPGAWVWRRLRWLAPSGMGAAATGLVTAVVLLEALTAPGAVSDVRTVPAVATAGTVPEQTAGATTTAVTVQRVVTPPRPGSRPRDRAEQEVARVPSPVRGNLEVGTTPNAPQRPLACVDTEPTGMVCIAKPVDRRRILHP